MVPAKPLASPQRRPKLRAPADAEDTREQPTIAVVGRPTAGKSTLVKCLSGVEQPTGGTLLFDVARRRWSARTATPST